ncbi:Dps family protein [Paenibacillus thalictri]|uniref:DNA starvation/stationary phase protection protein n=1 Tax=Paenibacillus thalictri TaxID=2527873 RepID=A0A4Q9DJR6_9BACL|nr:DNA starvation/stationary phase protection protein [Paenibacillus thalictri]TBL72684.1 DNA starvation/stationary phase protection protein [Paenibacillus thalictri]
MTTNTLTKDVTTVLNTQVANWNVLFVKLHNYHWYVKGPHFFTLHVKFEELYNEAAQAIDDLAERLLTLGGKPVATLKEALQTATVKEAAGGETAEQMVQTLAGDFQTVIGELKQGMSIAEAGGDQATSDMLLGLCSSLEKHVWMLRSFSGR